MRNLYYYYYSILIIRQIQEPLGQKESSLIFQGRFYTFPFDQSDGLGPLDRPLRSCGTQTDMPLP